MYHLSGCAIDVSSPEAAGEDQATHLVGSATTIPFSVQIPMVLVRSVMSYASFGTVNDCGQEHGSQRQGNDSWYTAYITKRPEGQ